MIIVGLAYDPVAGILYGSGIPWGGGETAVNDPNLYTINPQNGATTLVGNLGTIIQGLTWSSTLGLIGSFDHLYRINSNTGAATQVGTTDCTDGRGTGADIFNGVYGLAPRIEVVEPELTPFSITSISLNSEGLRVDRYRIGQTLLE